MDNETLTMIATRLANASEEEEENARSSGEELGREWAASFAQPSELRRMESANEDTSSWSALCESYPSIDDFVEWYDSYGGDLPDGALRLIEDPELAEAFCDSFVKSAMAVWEEVQAVPAAAQQNGE